MMEKNDQVVVNTMPEKTFQNSERTTDQIASLSERAAKAEARVKELQTKIQEDKKEITVSIKDTSKMGITPTTLMGLPHFITTKGAEIASFKIKNVDEADKFLTAVLESDLAKEVDELKAKNKDLELKIENKEGEIGALNKSHRVTKRIYNEDLADIRDAYNNELALNKKNAYAKYEKQLINKDIEHQKLENKVSLEQKEARLRELKLLGTIDDYAKANDALEEKVNEIEKSQKTPKTRAGMKLQTLLKYAKAKRDMMRFDRHPTAMGSPWSFM